MAITSNEFAGLARGQLKKKMVTRKPTQGGKLGSEPSTYNRSHQQKKIKPKKAGGNFTYGNPIGFNY
jgi:hypothetical protein